MSFIYKKGIFILSGVLLGCCFFITASPVYAVFDRSYSGCFERSGNDNTSATVWMKAPICTIQVQNTDSAEDSFEFTVQNLNPYLYEVTDSSAEQISLSTTETSLTFSVLLQASESTTLTITPWDYDASTADFWFAAIADPQTQSGGDTPNPIFVEIMDQLEVLNLPFTVIAGDLIKGSTSDEEAHEAEYELVDEVFQDFSGTTLPVPGDHDARQDMDTYYSALYGDRDYDFTYGNTHFIAINTIEKSLYSEGELTDEQYTWLEQTLTNSTSTHIVVYMHHPIVPPDWASSQGIDQDERLQLGTLFAEHEVELIVTGDAHGYDYSYIDETDITGLSGGFYQLVAGGAGGSMYNYDGDHFFVLLHVTEQGIEHTRVDYSTFDLSVDYNEENDGSESSVSLSLINNSSVDIPVTRAIINTVASDYYYAVTETGEYLEIQSASVGEIQRSYIELALTTGETQSITVRPQTAVLTGVENTVHINGYLSFDELPTAANLETELTVASAKTASTIEIDEWDTGKDSRQWSVHTGKSKALTYNVSGLDPRRSYHIYQKNNIIDAQLASSIGEIEFTHKNKKRDRTYSVVPTTEVVPEDIGALPASDGGAHFQYFNNKGTALTSFFAYDSDLKHGFHSQWLDIDGDNEQELAVVPTSGVNGNVKVFETDGTQIGNVFPFGKSYKKGVSLAVGDIDGNGAQELITAPQGNKRAVVKIYHYKNGDVKKKDSFRAYTPDYTSGVNVTTGDLNNDGDDEIIIGAREQKAKLKVYRWLSKKGEARYWFGAKPFQDHDDAANGLSLATGDVDFDGDDDIIVGSWAGGGTLQVLSYQPGKKRLRTTVEHHAFSRFYTGGVYIIAGNINANNKHEIIVAQRGDSTTSSKVRVFSMKKSGKKLRRLFNKTPFTSSYSDGIIVALTNIDSDQKQELIMAREQGSGAVKIYEPRNGKLKNVGSFSAYDNGFSGGVYLTQ